MEIGGNKGKRGGRGNIGKRGKKMEKEGNLSKKREVGWKMREKDGKRGKR